MRNFLFTLLTMLFASTAFANSYFYVDYDRINMMEYNWIPVKAHFEGRVSAWQVEVSLPEGLKVVGISEGPDMSIVYYDQNGDWQDFQIEASFNDDYSIISANTGQAQGYWWNNNEWVSYGNLKWEAGDFEMFYLIVSLDFGYGFDGGTIALSSTMYSDPDPRGGTVLDNGDNGTTAYRSTWLEAYYPVPYIDVWYSITEEELIIHASTDACGFIESSIDGESVIFQQDNDNYCNLTYTIPRTTEDQTASLSLQAGFYEDLTNEYYDVIVIPALGNIYDFEEEGIFYKIIGEHQVCLSFNEFIDYEGNKSIKRGSYSGDITVPSTVNHNGELYHVVAIRSQAFRDCYLPNIDLPNTVSTIGDYAFYNSSLSNILLPEGLTKICQGAFYDSRLSEINIPASVRDIGENAFESCRNLTQVYITDLASWCAINFADESSNPLGGNRVDYSSSQKKNHLYLNGDEVIHLDLPFGITSIGDYAFYGASNITEVTIPNTIKNIGDGAFTRTNLTRVNISDLAAWCEISFTGWGSNPLEVAHHLFLDGTEMTRLDLPSGITSISSMAFSGAYYITDVTIPNTVTSIGSWAFHECRNLTSIIIPDKVVSISDHTFRSCSSLSSVKIGENVETIGALAFAYCRALTDIIIPNSVTYIGSRAFYNCSGLTSITIPKSVTVMLAWVFEDCTNLNSITCLATTPPSILGGDLLNWSLYRSIILRVPQASVELYREVSPWKRFTNIVGILDIEPGDIDGDGVLNVNDVTGLIDIILEGTANIEDNPAADVNGDGIINVADVTTLIDMLLAAS